MQKSENRSPTILTNYTTSLALVEAGLGSILHSLHLPLSGQILSLNQIFFLTKATISADRLDRIPTMPANMSAVVALTKSFSPAGKRLTPMLAIAMQGNLFSLGQIILGVNPLGCMLGAILSGVWAFLQPLLLSFIFLGTFGFDLLQFFGKEFAGFVESYRGIVLYFAVGCILIKLALSVVAVLLAYKISDRDFARYQEKLLDKGRTASARRQFKSEQPLSSRVMRELNQPLLWLSLGLSLIYVVFNQVSYVDIIWIILRPIGAAFAAILLVHLLNQKRVLNLLRKVGLVGLADLLESVHEKIKTLHI